MNTQELEKTKKEKNRSVARPLLATSIPATYVDF